MPQPTDPDPSARTHRWRRPSAWLTVPGTVLLGLLLFLAVWLSQRDRTPDQPAALTLPTVTAERDPQPALPAPQPPEPAPEGSAGDRDGVFVLPEAPVQPAPVAGSLPRPQPTTSPESAGATGPEPGDRAPVPVHSPAPTYPARALRGRLSGEVVVRALVGVDGRPRRLEVVHSSSHRVLDQAALRAVRRWRFQPAVQEGRPVSKAVDIPFEFSQ